MKTRRHLIAWLGLVLPTLTIGALAIGLLAREQARLNAFAAQSVRAQVRTVADNIDLTMAEIKSGTMQALQAASGPGEEEARLQELASTNPFIAHYLIWAPQPQSVARPREVPRPVASGSGQAEATQPLQLQTFLVSGMPMPWQQLPPRRQHHAMQQRNAAAKNAAENAAESDATVTAAATAAIADKTATVAAANALAAPQYVARSGQQPATNPAASPTSLTVTALPARAYRTEATEFAEVAETAETTKPLTGTGAVPETVTAATGERGTANTYSTGNEYGTIDSYGRARLNRQNIRNISQQNIEALNTLRVQEIDQSYLYRGARPRDRSLPAALQDTALAETLPAQSTMASDWAPRREGISGWIERFDGTPGWLGWYQRVPGGRVTAVILDSEAVLEQLQGPLPTGGELRLRLIAPGGKPFPAAAPHGSGSSLLPPSPPPTRFGVGFELPGWSLAAESTPTIKSSGFFLLGGLLVAILCASTLGAGTLLLLQARRDTREAARKTTFVANVSHELRTPLTTIRMYTEMLAEERISDPQRRKRYFDTITAESQRLSRLVDNVLDFGRLEQGGKQYRSEPVDIGALVQSVLDSQAPRLRQAAMQVHWQPPAEPVLINTDPDALGQVLLNLTDNALKYAAGGQYLQISLRPQTGGKGAIELCVEDRGPGIAPADRQRAFKAFQRLDESLTNTVQGSGLGLSICRAIVEGLGGRIALESAEAGGCRFRITLPAAAGRQQTATTASTTAS